MHVDGWVRAVVVLGCLAGCQAFDPSLLDERASFGEMSEKDGGHAMMHAGDACVGGDELCNALDDDCDGKIDEDANHDCVASHSTGVCASAGECVLAACESGYLDCNERVQDGCEEHTERCANGNTGVPTRDAGTGDVSTGEDEPDRGPTHDDDDDDAGSVVVVPPPPPVDAGPTCMPTIEVCNGRDDNCNGKIDEAPLDCALEACVAGTPSYRGEACDRCACQKCGANLMQCQNNSDTHWAMLCRDVAECYVTNSRAGNCGNNEDCYGTGNGPCATQINLASGGSSGTDGSKAATGCAVSNPPTTACAAVTQYRDQCVRDLCMTECGS
jgi:hypothetical protein